MKNNLSDMVMDWKTFVGVAGILMGGVVWTNSQLWKLESHITENRIEVIKEIGNLRSEISQYHTMIGSLQNQQNKLENLVLSHQLSRKLHK